MSSKIKSQSSASGESRQASRKPRYLEVRDQLEQDIRQGKYAVGELMPKEEVLAAQYGVSRHTIREAMRGLVDAGMVERFPKRGSFVTATDPVSKEEKFVAGVSNIHDVLQYTAKTRMTILYRSRERLPEALAKDLNFQDRDYEWIRFVCCRYQAENTQLIGFCNLYMMPEHESIVEDVQDGAGKSIFKLLETECNIKVRKVWQKIEASLMPEEAPYAFRKDRGAPALRLLRSYYDENGTMLNCSDNYFLSDRFQLIAQWEYTGDQ